MLSPYAIQFGSPQLRRRILDIIPNADLQKLKRIVDTMFNGATKIFELKKKALEAGDEATVQQIGEGKDIMSILSML